MNHSAISRGARTAIDGLRFAVRDPGVRKAYLRVVMGLLLLTLIIDVLGLWSLFHFVDPNGADATWLAIVYWLVRVLGGLAILLVGPLLAVLTMNVIFPFFNVPIFMAGLHAQDPERAGRLAAKPGLPLAASAGIAARRLLRFVGLSLMFLIIGLIPVLGSVVATIGQLWLSARTLSWELMDPYFDRLDLRWADQRRLIDTHRDALLGFGLPMALLMAIPLVGPLMFGWAQGAAATFVVREVPPDPREWSESTPALRVG